MCVGCMRVKKMNVEYKYVNLLLNSVKGGCVTNKILTELCVCLFCLACRAEFVLLYSVLPILDVQLREGIQKFGSIAALR